MQSDVMDKSNSMDKIIRIEDLTYTYPGAQQPTLSHVSLEIEKGDFLAVVGNNGCGKSTLCKVLNGLIPHFIAGEFSGSVLLTGKIRCRPMWALSPARWDMCIRTLKIRLSVRRVLDDASYACLNYGMADYEREEERRFISAGWKAGGRIHLAAFRRADPPAGAGGSGGAGTGNPDFGRAHRPAGSGARRPHL